MATDVPYVSTAAFQAHPTYLDLDGLRVGSPDPSDQTAELNNILLKASAWADNQCNQPLGAHVKVQKFRQRLDRYGRLLVHADENPVVAVTGLSWGYSPTALNVVTDLSGVWVEDDRQIVMTLPGPSIPSLAGLQFGGSTGEVYVQLAYTAGFVATVLGAAASSGATTLTVADPTGIVPGGQYRIWEPGVEETVIVSPSWTPPAATAAPVAASVALAAPTQFAHTKGHDLSGMPAEVRTAVIQYATALLMRPDSTAEDEFPNTSLGSDTRRNDPRNGTGLIADAARTLSSYGRIR
jgi:hypothetical protein